jgi:membrane peptidoglycan carboxypeptidase
VFCPPKPVRSVTDSTGKPVTLKAHAGCSRQFTPYVARTLANIMTDDTTKGHGTASRFFYDWYNEGGSEVAGKTGTNNSSKFDPVTRKFVDDEGNSALWFVGITPNLVSTAAVVNPERPTQRIADVPGITEFNSGTDTFGASASKFWKMAFGPTLLAQEWTWPSVESTPGNPVPSVTGMGQSEAISYLASQGFVGKPLAVPCGSRERPGNVAFYSPKIAEPGATISLCISTGVPAEVYEPPVFRPWVPPSTSFSPQPAPQTSAAPAPTPTPPAPQPSATKPANPKPTKPR